MDLLRQRFMALSPGFLIANGLQIAGVAVMFIFMRQFWLAAFLAIVGCASNAAETRKLKVLTSFLPVYSFTVNVAGDLADVENLLPPGASPHDFQLSHSDVRKFNRADVLIINGLGVETWLDKLMKSAGEKRKVIAMSQGLGKGTNPHIWLDPILAAHAVTNILRALQAADPVNAQGYANNANTFIQKLYDLDRAFREGLAPAKGTAIITDHDAFAHLAQRYGLRVAGVIEETAEVSPKPSHVAKLGRIIRTQGVKAIFTEAEHPQKRAEQLAQDYRVRLAPLHTLESGDLSRTAYEEGMRKNLAVLKNTLINHASANAQ